MPGGSSSLRSAQARKAAACRWNHPDQDEKARDYAAERLAEYIRKTVDAAPPLTAEQRTRLAGLLQGGGRHAS